MEIVGFHIGAAGVHERAAEEDGEPNSKFQVATMPSSEQHQDLPPSLQSMIDSQPAEAPFEAPLCTEGMLLRLTFRYPRMMMRALALSTPRNSDGAYDSRFRSYPTGHRSTLLGVWLGSKKPRSSNSPEPRE
jgi:hypothetical protein